MRLFKLFSLVALVAVFFVIPSFAQEDVSSLEKPKTAAQFYLGQLLDLQSYHSEYVHQIHQMLAGDFTGVEKYIQKILDTKPAEDVGLNLITAVDMAGLRSRLGGGPESLLKILAWAKANNVMADPEFYGNMYPPDNYGKEILKAVFYLGADSSIKAQNIAIEELSLSGKNLFIWYQAIEMPIVQTNLEYLKTLQPDVKFIASIRFKGEFKKLQSELSPAEFKELIYDDFGDTQLSVAEQIQLYCPGVVDLP